MAKKIAILSREQKARIPEYIEKWTKIGLSSTPANTEEAERGIRMAYELAGLPSPEKIVWCDSPLTLCLSRDFLFWFITEHCQLPNLLLGPCVSEKVVIQPRLQAEMNIRETVRSSICQRIGTMLSDPVTHSVWDLVWSPINGLFRDYLSDDRGDDEIFNRCIDSLHKSMLQIFVPLLGRMWYLVKYEYFWQNAEEYFHEHLLGSICDCGYGQHDAGWLGYCEYFKEVCGLEDETRILGGLWLISKNAGWILPHEKICFVGHRPSGLKWNKDLQLHNEEGPALSYPDGISIWSFHGRRVARKIFDSPEMLTLSEIASEQDVVLRNFLIRRYGELRYLLETGGKLIHEDELGSLYEKSIPGDEPVVTVKIEICTRESNGLYFDHFLRVPPHIKTAREAIAWTFGKRADHYWPSLET